MTGPRPLPAPSQQCLFGWVVLVGSWFAAGVTAFVVGVVLARRRWELSR